MAKKHISLTLLIVLALIILSSLTCVATPAPIVAPLDGTVTFRMVLANNKYNTFMDFVSTDGKTTRQWALTAKGYVPAAGMNINGPNEVKQGAVLAVND